MRSGDFTPFDNDNSKWLADLVVNNTLISFRIHTNVLANIFPFRLFLNLQNCPKLQPFRFGLSAYNETNISVKGCCILGVTRGVTSIQVLFHAVDNDSPSMLELKTTKNLDLIGRITKINRYVPDYLQQYTNYFGKIGFLKEKHHIIVDRESISSNKESTHPDV